MTPGADRGGPAADTGAELPPPPAEARAHSARLAALIAQAIDEAGGVVGFDRYMDLALNAPAVGYYSAGARKFGPAGDFVTAPELSPLFARCLARQCREILAVIPGGDILEYGPGTGALAADLLAELERLDALPTRYRLFEVSADLRERQRERLGAQVPHLMDRVEWLEAPPASIRGVVLANEVLDALPVRRFRIDADHGAAELGVARAGDGGFGWRERDTDTVLHEAVAQVVESLPERLPAGYVSELSLALGPWIGSLAAMLEQGVALLIDYGYPRAEYYHPQRHGGTLKCHYRHRVHDDPFLWPGLQDITAHVDFTAVAEAADEAGLQVGGYTTQAQFLLANGLTDYATAGSDDAVTQLDVAGQVKRLTLPGEMGEAVKVMALQRGIDRPLAGFHLRDLRVGL